MVKRPSIVLATGLGKGPLFWVLQCAGWAAFGLAMVRWGLEYWTLRETLQNKALLVALGFGLTIGFRPLYRWGRQRSRSPLVFPALVGTLSLAGAVVWRETHAQLLGAAHAAADGRSFTLEWIPLPVGTLIYDGLVLLAWSLLYAAVNAAIELEKERRRAAAAEALAREARLQALQSQLEPHFLFNTLNAISTLVAEGRNPAAQQMVARLSDFLRVTLEAAETPEVSVAEEVEFVRRYLDIEQARFGDRLRVTIAADEDTLDALVPALLLQPLVENAVRHGVLQREQGGSVLVSIRREAGRLRVSVVDDGPGPAPHPAPRGVGLANTAVRLTELYGEEGRLSLEPAPGGGAAATVELPYRRRRPPAEARPA